MDNKTLRKVQLKELEILKEIKRVCDKNNINYWLDSGTLLGAVRHKGFIPWDDDSDVGMKREDYNKFLSIAEKELGDRFYLGTWHNSNHFGSPFAKVMLKGTKFIENNKVDSLEDSGIWVDIFPYDYIAYDDKGMNMVMKLEHLKRLIYMKTGRESWVRGNGSSLREKLAYNVYLLISKVCSLQTLINKYEKIANTYNLNGKGNKIYQVCDEKFGRLVYPKDIFDELDTIQFEDDVFSSPKRYKEYLTITYGDYMQLPPKEEREKGHNIVEVDFGD